MPTSGDLGPITGGADAAVIAEDVADVRRRCRRRSSQGAP